MRTFAIIFILFYLMSAVAYGQNRQQFKAAVDDIIGDDSYVISYVDYAFTPKFIKLSDQKSGLPASCLDLISYPKSTHSEKIIAIMLMNKTSPENYILFLDKLFIIYKAGHINQYELWAALCPPHPLIDVITDNYKLPIERALLSKMILCHCLPKNTSHQLFDVLTGKTKRDTDAFYRECCTPYTFKIWSY